MYTIIQKIYEKNNKILKEGLKKVLSGEDVSSLTGAIKDFTDILGKELFKPHTGAAAREQPRDSAVIER